MLNVGGGSRQAIFTLYYLENKGGRDLKFIVTKDCVFYGKFILRSMSQDSARVKRKELIILYVSLARNDRK